MSDDYSPSNRLSEDLARMRATMKRRRASYDYIDEVDFHELLNGTAVSEPPTSDLLRREDGVGLIPRGTWSADEMQHSAGKVSNIWAPHEHVKTMIAQAAAVQLIAAMSPSDLDSVVEVMYIDADHNGAEAMMARLLMLGMPRDRLQSKFRLYEPQTGIEVLEAVERCAEYSSCGMVIIDAVDEVVALLGGDPNKGDDVSTIMRTVTDPLVKAGHGVTFIDHTAKTSDGRGPSGSAVKQRLITGTSLEVRLIRPFVPGHGGAAELWVVKNRDGDLRSKCPNPGQPRQLAGTFVLDPPGPDGVASWRVESPWPSSAPGAVAGGSGSANWPAAIAGMTGEFTVDQLVDAALGAAHPTRSQRAMARRAIKELVDDGTLKVAHDGGGRGNPTTWRAVP